MKNIVYIIGFLLVFACDSEDASDCLQTTGNTVLQEVTVANFNRILVNRDVELVVKQGINQQVIIETGENLLNDVSAEVFGDQLILTDNNSCNFVREFGITKVYVTTPNLTEIRCSTQFEISSDGILAFDDLVLVSENFSDSDSFPIGDFKMQLDIDDLQITSNNLSFFYLSGQVENLDITFAGGNGRLEGETLIAENVTVFHRGTNDILVNPQQSLSGKILSTGNIISFNQPAVVNVEEVFTGQLLFN